MFESVGVGLVVAAAGFLLRRWWQREKIVRGLAKAAGGEYLNWSKAERVLKNQNRPTGHENSPHRHLVDEINQQFVKKRLVESKALFDELELSEAQRLAIVRDEDANLINAGAGSGKTRTILAKVKYLIDRELAKPSEILVVVYNKKTGQEIREKSEKISPEITVSTFHAFGRAIISKVENQRVDISPLADDDKVLSGFLSEKMKGLLKDIKILRLLLDFFSTYRFDGNPEEGIKTKEEYYQKISQLDLRSLNGVQLKSFQEVQIANWFILNGIRWEYEREYPHNEGKRQHKPDFYLPDYDLWIEHFGIDEHGNTAPWVDNSKYKAEIKWKRDTHRNNKTQLVETYSYEGKNAGGLQHALEKKLIFCGVKKSVMSDAEVDRIVEKSFAPTSNFVKLIKQFLSLSRENKLSGEKLQTRAASVRDRVFLALFNLFRGSYEKKIQSENKIDFTDMIVRGMKHVKSGRYQSQFKYILVDEYQDITKTRLEFLLAMQRQVPDARLFCVGDDWQSIYQFQGANVGLITQFQDYVGAMERTDLDKTFRYSQKINDFSRLFVTKNPMQLKKSVTSAIASEENERPVRIVYYDEKSESHTLKKIADFIAEKSQGNKTTCFVLGRYNHNTPDDWNEIAAHAKDNGVVMKFSTIHKSKGRESDWVVVMENKSSVGGNYNFPSDVQEDSVLRMVKPQTDNFRNAEERRLFYVAVTRTRRVVFLLTPIGEASEFIREIDPRFNDEYLPFVHVNRNPEATILTCPECGGQTIRKKSGAYGEFYACSRYPLCSGRLPTCGNEDCGAAVDLAGLTLADMHECECGRKSKICPQCRCGILVQRQRPGGQSGAFWGCSQFSVAECKYTENVNPVPEKNS